MPVVISDYLYPDKDQQLLTAIEKGDLQKVKQFESSGFNLNTILHSTATRESTNLLGNAAYHGQIEIMRYLLSAGALVHYKDPLLRRNALHWACIGGHVSAVCILIDHGIDVDTRDRDHVTPLLHAILYASNDAIKVLIKAGCDVMTSDRLDCSPIHYASFRGTQPVIELLIKNGCVAQQISVLGTPMSNLIHRRDTANIRLLVEAGYDLKGDDEIEKQLRTLSLDHAIYRYINDARLNAAPLMRMCRSRIRKALGSKGLLKKIGLLPLPNKIKDYVSMNEIS